MMTRYDPADVVPLSEFAYAWRITDERWDRLPNTQLERIFPLSVVRGKQLTQHARAFRYPGALYVNTREYHVVSECSAQVPDEEKVELWFATLPLEPDEAVYVSWSEGTAIVTDWNWKTFTEVWNSLWYLDVLAVFDDTRKWAVLFGPEEYAAFVKRGAADPHSSDSPYGAGYNLIRIRSQVTDK